MNFIFRNSQWGLKDDGLHRIDGRGNYHVYRFLLDRNKTFKHILCKIWCDPDMWLEVYLRAVEYFKISDCYSLEHLKKLVEVAKQEAVIRTTQSEILKKNDPEKYELGVHSLYDFGQMRAAAIKQLGLDEDVIESKSKLLYS